MATPYGYYGNTLTDIQTGINQAAQIEQQRMAAQEAARAQRFNALMEMRSQQARNQAALQQSAQQNAFNMAGLQQEERIAGLDRGVRERELEAVRKQREFQEIQRQRELEAARRHDIDMLERENKIPDPRLAIERERSEFDRRGMNTEAEATARQANALLLAERQRLLPEYRAKLEELDTFRTGRGEAVTGANAFFQEEWRKKVAELGDKILASGVNVTYNPATQRFEAVPMEAFPTTGIPGAAGPVQTRPTFVPPSGVGSSYGPQLPPSPMGAAPQTNAPPQLLRPNPGAPPGVTIQAPGSPGTLVRWKLLPDGSLQMPDGRIIPASP